MRIANSLLPRVAPRNARVLVVARGNATSTANVSQTKRAGKTPLTPGGVNFGSYLTERANQFEHKDLLVIPSEDIRNTFIEVKKSADEIAIGLHDIHVREGEVFVSVLPEISHNLFLALGTARAGVTYIPFTPKVPLENLLATLKARKARAFLVPDLVANRNYIEELYKAIPEIDLQRKDYITPFTPLYYPKLQHCFVWSKDNKEYHGFDGLYGLPTTDIPFRNPLPKMASIPIDKPILLLPQADSLNFDSVSQSALLNTGHALLEALSATINDRVSFTVPYNGIGYFLAAGCISHGTVLIQANKPFDANATIKTISRDKASILVIGANDLGSLLSATAKADLSTLRAVVIVGRLDANVVQQATQLGAKQVFGIEQIDGHSGQFTGIIQTGAGKAVPLPGVEAKVVDGQGKPVSVGTKGSLRTKGDGWIDTKLQAQMDSNGVFTL